MGTPTPPHGRVRIWVGDPPRVAGAGVLVSADVVITCLHVVQAEDGERALITVDFPDAANGGRAPAVVAEACPPTEDRGGDLAALRLARPAGSRPARLVDRAADDQKVRVFGFPVRVPEGVWVTATVTGDVGRRTAWRQLDRWSGPTAAIERGFSGGGVYDDSGSVVGLVAARVVLSGQVVAWMIPVARWPELLPATSLEIGHTDGPAEPPTLSFPQKHALAEALGRIVVIDDVESRRLVVRNLSFSGSVPHYATKSVDIFALVRTVLEFPGGFAELYDVVAALAGPNAGPVVALRELAVSYGLLPEGDEQS